MEKFDLIVMGAGPAGYIAAIRAAQLGAKVCLIEQDKVGGTCLNRGCIPTKAIIYCVNFYAKILKAQDYGISTQNTQINLAQVIERKDKLIAKIVKSLEQLIQKNQIQIIYGQAKAINNELVEITKADNTVIKAETNKLILATGSLSMALPNLTFDHEQYLNSDDILDLKIVPEKLDIVGGGVIGIHFAHIFSNLGTQVTIYEALPEILNGVEEEIVSQAKRILLRKKINILTNTRFEAKMSCGKTLISIGRKANLQGLEALKLKIENNKIVVNSKMETNLSGVYAVGDLVSHKMFAHVAYEQGYIAAENAMERSSTFSYDFVPYGIYTEPEISGIGLTENEAKHKHANIKVSKFPFATLGIAQATGNIEGFIKVIADDSGKILGIHAIGPEANTLIGSATLALKNNLTIDQLAKTFQAHPSYAESLHEAALGILKKSLHNLN